MSFRTLSFAILFFAAVFSLAWGDDPAPLPVEVAPSDAAIRYSGRFDLRDTAGPQCSWPASTITLITSATEVEAKFKESGKNLWQIEIDGQPKAKLPLQSREHLYTIATGLSAGEHTIKLIKATEGHVGVTQFLGFELNAGAVAQSAPPATRRLEVIGDSISCGYGVEAKSQNEPFTPQTENAYFAYGEDAARALDADYVCIAFSGRKLWPDNTVPELYDRTLTFDANSRWDFSKWVPDAVVINLGTNDAGSAPDETGWTGAYEKFIAHVRHNYPNAQIYCATGPMLREKEKAMILAYVQKVVSDENASGDTKVHALDFGEQTWKNGFGANWHPSQKTQQAMADLLVTALQKDLGWK